jgi:hypothetical protein
MKWEMTPAFQADLRRLSSDELTLFRQVSVEEFSPAADRKAEHPAARWPKKLRVKNVKGAEGIWEMTWSFEGPDGRATFEWVTIEDEPGIRWRRVGGHEIFDDPAR